MEKKLDGNYTRILREILNKSRRQHPTNQQLYGHLPPITKTIKFRRVRHAEHYWRSRVEFIRDLFLEPLLMDEQRQDDQLESTYCSSVAIRDITLKTCRKQWTIGRGGERGSGISVLMARHDDVDDVAIHKTIQLNINEWRMLLDSNTWNRLVSWVWY